MKLPATIVRLGFLLLALCYLANARERERHHASPAESESILHGRAFPRGIFARQEGDKEPDFEDELLEYFKWATGKGCKLLSAMKNSDKGCVTQYKAPKKTCQNPWADYLA